MKRRDWGYREQKGCFLERPLPAFVKKRFERMSSSSSSKHRKNAFTLSEALLAFLVGMICVSLLSVQTRVLSSSLRIRDDSQEQFAILQLRELCSLSWKASVSNGQLHLQWADKAETVALDQRRLVKKPGYEIFMENIDSAVFTEHQGIIELEVMYENHKKTWQIQ